MKSFFVTDARYKSLEVCNQLEFMLKSKRSLPASLFCKQLVQSMFMSRKDVIELVFLG